MRKNTNQISISSATEWSLLYLGGPIFPYIVKVIVRILTNAPYIEADVFDASDLALISVFIWLFVRQSLVDKEIILKNDYKRRETRVVAYLCFGAASLFFAFYVLIEAFTSLGLESLFWSKIVVFFLFFLSLLFVLRIQSSFDLQAKLI